MGSVGQISLFDGAQRFRIEKPIRLIELFAGIGSQAKALTNLGVEFEHYRICEFDKYAVTSYNAINGTNFQPSDITKLKGEDLGIVDTDKYCYLLTYSFPCQDLSNAGKGKGMEKGSGTRSGLLWEVERLLTETKELPTVLVMENVPQVVSEKNMKDFAQWIAFLDGLGYKSKWEILNAKDYGIPQNRERCFMVSILGDYYYEFPAKKPLKKRLKDMLEDSVDGKYYLSDKALNGVLNTSFNCSKLDSRTAHNGVIPTLCARDYKDPKLVVEEPKVRVREATKKGYDEAAVGDAINIEQPNSETRRGRVGHGVAQTLTTQPQQPVVVGEPKLMQVAQLTDKKYNEMTGRVYSDEGLCPTIRTKQGGCSEPKVAEPIAYDEQNEYLRKDGCVGALTTAVSSPKHNNRVVEPLVWDGFNQRVRAESECVGTITQNVGADLKRNGTGIIEPLEKYELSDKMKAYINSYDDKYKVGDGNLVVNRDVACSKTTREGSTRADASDYISNEFGANENIAGKDVVPYRIRKLTPKECWRLMGFDDTDIDKAISIGMSNTQLYKQAGNSIVVNVLDSIFGEMLE